MLIPLAAAGALLVLGADADKAWTVEGAAELRGGALSGVGVRDSPAAVISPRGELKPSLRLGPVELELPVKVEHRQTFGARLTQLTGKLGASVQWRIIRPLRLEAAASVRGVWRPGWADLYQPLGDGLYVPTDRYSHLDRELSLRAAWRPARGHHGRLKVRAGDFTSLQDPAFDPIGAPMHLTPRNHRWRDAELGWRWLADGFKLGASLQGFQRDSLFLFARDSETGRTHAGPGGAPPNPLQSVRGLEPGIEGELTVSRQLELSAGLGVEAVSDLFDGYYSFTGLHPQLSATALFGDVVLKIGAAAHLRRFGDNAYAEGPRHPPLSWGTRREDRLFSTNASLTWPLTERLAFTAEARWNVRSTNFPAYSPGVFPATRGYDIDWSYTRIQVLTGLRWSTDGG